MANLAQIRAQSIAFQALKSVRDLTRLVGESTHTLSLLALKPHYHVFEIPKKNGKKRIIEAPEENLKKVLQKINDYLLNIDFQDFFHDVSFDKVHHIFAQHFPKPSF